VTITGTGFTGPTNVLFNGTLAVSMVLNSTHVRATVPAGATTGPVSVNTTSGTATSSSDFTIP
jgi:hypothetical protein